MLEELMCCYDKLQLIYGDKNLDSIYNGGCERILKYVLYL